MGWARARVIEIKLELITVIDELFDMKAAENIMAQSEHFEFL